MVLGFPFPLTMVGEDWLHGAPLTAEVLACGDKEGERLSSKFQRQEDALSAVGVSKSGQYIVATVLEYDTGAFWTTFFTWPIYTGHSPDLQRPHCHRGHHR